MSGGLTVAVVRAKMPERPWGAPTHPPILEARRPTFRFMLRNMDVLCPATPRATCAGQTGDLEMALATPPPRLGDPLARGELESLVDMAGEWSLLLGSGK